MWYVWCGLFFLASVWANAQTPYGNEWLNPAQTYLRIGTTQDGWYRLNAAELRKQGLDLTKIPAQSLQLFRRGQEVAMHVSGEADGRLDSLDFVEFYGQRNDGWLDTLLYVRHPSLMPHPHYSLYSDTATYFLTWRTDGKAGRRIAQVAASPSAPAITYHRETVLQVQTNEYAAGAIYPPGAGPDDGYLPNLWRRGRGLDGRAAPYRSMGGRAGLADGEPNERIVCCGHGRAALRGPIRG